MEGTFCPLREFCSSHLVLADVRRCMWPAVIALQMATPQDDLQRFASLAARDWKCPRATCHKWHLAGETACSCGMKHPKVAQALLKEKDHAQRRTSRRPRSSRSPVASAPEVKSPPVKTPFSQSVAKDPFSAAAGEKTYAQAVMSAPPSGSPFSAADEKKDETVEAPLSDSDRVALQNKLNQLQDAHRALKNVEGLQDTTASLEWEMESIRHTLHRSKPLAARLEALEASIKRKTDACEVSAREAADAEAAMKAAELRTSTLTSEIETLRKELSAVRNMITLHASTSAPPSPQRLLAQAIAAIQGGAQLPQEWLLQASALCPQTTAVAPVTPFQMPPSPVSPPAAIDAPPPLVKESLKRAAPSSPSSEDTRRKSPWWTHSQLLAEAQRLEAEIPITPTQVDISSTQLAEVVVDTLGNQDSKQDSKDFAQLLLQKQIEEAGRTASSSTSSTDLTMDAGTTVAPRRRDPLWEAATTTSASALRAGPYQR